MWQGSHWGTRQSPRASAASKYSSPCPEKVGDHPLFLVCLRLYMRQESAVNVCSRWGVEPDWWSVSIPSLSWILTKQKMKVCNTSGNDISINGQWSQKHSESKLSPLFYDSLKIVFKFRTPFPPYLADISDPGEKVIVRKMIEKSNKIGLGVPGYERPTLCYKPEQLPGISNT